MCVETSPSRALSCLTLEDVPLEVSEKAALGYSRAPRPVGDEERKVVVDGIRCPTVTTERSRLLFGKTRPILLVHGRGHDAGDFALLFAARPKGYRLIALDFPGFGHLDKPARDYPRSLLIRAVLRAVYLCDEPPLILGSSLGGHVAMLAALEQPYAFAGLCLLAPGGLFRVPLPTQAIARAYYSYAAIISRPEREVVGNSRRIFASPSEICERIAANKLAIRRSPLLPRFARPFASVVDDVFRRPVAERIAEIRPPIQIVFGEHDRIVDPQEARRVAARHGIPFQLLEGVGHLPMLETPERFAQLLLGFAEDTFGGKR